MGIHPCLIQHYMLALTRCPWMMTLHYYLEWFQKQRVYSHPYLPPPPGEGGGHRDVGDIEKWGGDEGTK